MRTLRLTVAYDGSRLPRVRRQRRGATVGGVLADGLERGARPPGRAHLRRPHRHRRARPGPGRHLRRPARRPRPRPALAASAQQPVAPDRRRARPAAVVADRLRRPVLGRGPAATATRSSTGRCPTRSWPDGLARARGRSTSPPCVLACDPLIGEHDFSAVLPAAEAPRRRRGVAGAAGHRGGLGRRRRRPAALRDRGVGVLPPDGAQHRRDAGRGRAPAGVGPARWPASSPRARAWVSATWRRPTACACRRSATTVGPRENLSA